jgi:G3E family GTPase
VIPLHVLTGFLGSGKTTLLSRLLRDPAAERPFVLVNEAGDLALDHDLLERIDEDVLALPAGCACCAVRDELVETLARVLKHAPRRIVLETSGLADPAPILHALASDARLSAELRVAGVVAVCDAERLEELLLTQPEVGRQLDLADRIVLSKGDLAPLRAAAARELLAAQAPGREVREAVHGAVDAAWLLADAPLSAVRDASSVGAWLHHAPDPQGAAPGHPFRTHAVERQAPAAVELVQLWLSLVTQLDGRHLARIKALVECAATGDVFALQSAGHALSPPRRLERPPRGFRGVRLVVIERGLPDAAARRLLGSLDEALAGTRAVARATRV